MKKQIHVDSYSRSRHGRATHGGAVSEHDKGVDVVDMKPVTSAAIGRGDYLQHFVNAVYGKLRRKGSAPLTDLERDAMLLYQFAHGTQNAGLDGWLENRDSYAYECDISSVQAYHQAVIKAIAKLPTTATTEKVLYIAKRMLQDPTISQLDAMESEFFNIDQRFYEQVNKHLKQRLQAGER